MPRYYHSLRSSRRESALTFPLLPLSLALSTFTFTLTFTLILLSPSSFAASALVITNAPLPNPPLADMGTSVIRLVGALALVFALFFGGTWLAKNWQRFTRGSSSGSKLKIVEAKSIGARQALLVIRYEQHQLLLASSPNGVSLVSHLPDAIEPEPANTGPCKDASRTVPEGFPQLIQRFFGRS